MAKIKKKEPNCADCANRMPELIQENQKLFECFTLGDSQLRVGFGGPYGMDWNIIIKIARSMRIQINRTFWRMLRAFETTMIEEISKKHDKDNPNSR